MKKALLLILIAFYATPLMSMPGQALRCEQDDDHIGSSNALQSGLPFEAEYAMQQSISQMHITNHIAAAQQIHPPSYLQTVYLPQLDLASNASTQTQQPNTPVEPELPINHQEPIQTHHLPSTPAPDYGYCCGIKLDAPLCIEWFHRRNTSTNHFIQECCPLAPDAEVYNGRKLRIHCLSTLLCASYEIGCCPCITTVCVTGYITGVLNPCGCNNAQGHCNPCCPMTGQAVANCYKTLISRAITPIVTDGSHPAPSVMQ